MNASRSGVFLLVALAFLLPIAALPIVSVLSVKGFLWYIGVIVLSLIGLMHMLRTQTIVLPRSLLMLSLGVIPLVYVIASVTSGSPLASLVGEGSSVDTFVTVCAGMLAIVFGALSIRSKQDVVTVYGAVLLSSVVVFVVGLVQLIWGLDVVSLGRIGEQTVGLLGSWTDYGILFGLIAAVSLVTLVVGEFPRRVRGIAGILLVLSLAMVLIADVTGLWYLIGLGALVLLLYRASLHKERAFSAVALVVLLVSLVVILGEGPLQQGVQQLTRMTHIEVRPSLQATLEVAHDTLKEDVLFGAGPNRFGEQWLLHKPAGVNETPFWGVMFSHGFGFIPTTLVTSGVLGFAAWLFFIGMLLTFSWKALFVPKVDSFTRYLLILAVISVIYLWIAFIVYAPTIALFALACLFTAVLFALLIQEDILSTKTIDIRTSPRAHFVTTFVFLIVILGLVMGGYVVGIRFMGSALVDRGIYHIATSGDIDRAEQLFERAALLYGDDRVYSNLAQVGRQRLATLLSASELSDDTRRREFQTRLGRVVNYSEQAIGYDPENYENWALMGMVYQDLVPLQIAGAREVAEGAYQEAQRRNPRGPDIELMLARLALAAGDVENARLHIAEAREHKSNYTNAIFLLAQIEVAEGNVDEAIASVEEATTISPNDPTLFFQLGLLRYTQEDYAGAVSSFETAVVLNPAYANARYFLGLSYYEEGRRSDAVAQFEYLRELDADNEEVVTILENLRSGRTPFADVVPPLATPPEEREELPVEEPIIEE